MLVKPRRTHLSSLDLPRPKIHLAIISRKGYVVIVPGYLKSLQRFNIEAHVSRCLCETRAVRKGDEILRYTDSDRKCEIRPGGCASAKPDIRCTGLHNTTGTGSKMNALSVQTCSIKCCALVNLPP